MDTRFETISATKIKPGMVICGVNNALWGDISAKHYEILSVQKGDYSSTIKLDLRNIEHGILYRMVYDTDIHFIILKDPLNTTHKQQAVLNKIRYLNERYENLRSEKGTMSRMS